ncbi:MAG: cobyric acid synthase [Candidatus Hydrogenedentota bacterium]|nr:MAG: cobyric acid synthase [Candidatus Hydrogenedentota bacterium]
MIQGTGSNVGKSVMVAGLCRIFLQDGHHVAPFKSQNMALNSFVTREGHEMGRAQAVQAQACRLEPDVNMNPVLIKPSSDCMAQVVVMGEPAFNLPAETFLSYKGRVESVVRDAYKRLADTYETVVIEGAGSPAEINLREGDIVNMAMAEIADAPVILVGDIDKGGVFASFVGTLELLLPHERDRVRGFIINKFRGSRSLLRPAIDFLEQRTRRPVFGVVPYFTDIKIPEEDSLAGKAALVRKDREDTIDITIVFLPHVSNFTDFDAFEDEPDVNLRYLRPGEPVGDTDVLFLPGTKSTMDDLAYLRQRGIERQLLDLARADRAVLIGICGGYQILGKKLLDPQGVESQTRETRGLGLLDVETTFLSHKSLCQAKAVHIASGLEVRGYEIHMGVTERGSGSQAAFEITQRGSEGDWPPDDGAVAPDGNVWGTYLHGAFDDDRFRRHFIDSIRIRKGLKPLGKVVSCYDTDAEYDKLAALLRKNLDIEGIYRLLS